MLSRNDKEILSGRLLYAQTVISEVTTELIKRSDTEPVTSYIAVDLNELNSKLKDIINRLKK